MGTSASPHLPRPDDARELLAGAWFTIGFPPSGSAVLVALREDAQPGLVARVDLPRRVEHARLIGDALAGAARQDEADAVVLVLVPRPRSRRPPVLVRTERALGRAVHAGPAHGGPGPAAGGGARGGVGRAVVGGGGGAPSGPAPAGGRNCPRPGVVPRGAPGPTATGAALVLQGRTLVATEAELAADVRPQPWPAG